MNFSLTKRTWLSSANCYNSLVRYVTSNNSALMCRGDVWKPTSEVQPNAPDVLLNRLRASSSTSRLLQLVRENYKKMDEKHTVQALKALFMLQKDGNSDLSTEKLMGHPDFEKICRNIKRYSGIVDINDAIDALKTLSYVGVKSYSMIVQVLLQIVRGNVNQLSIPQVLFLNFLLMDMENTPLVEALRIALPMVFEINVKKKMNNTNPVQMTDCLYYAIKKNLSQETVNFILEKLETYPGEFDGNTARGILNAVCLLPRNPIYQTIVNRVSTDLVVNIENVAIINMEICLNRLTHHYTNRCKFYYQEVLFDTCANYIIDHNIGYKRALGVARNMARLHHFHQRLSDYISTCIYRDPDIKKDSADIYSIAVFLALTDYKPAHWEHLKEWIKKCKELAVENRKEIIWARFASALCLLDIYKIDVLGRALNEEYVRHLLEKKFHSNFEQYSFTWQCISTYKPDLAELLPNLDPKDLVVDFAKNLEPSLEGAMHKALGGEQFVLTNLYSKLGVHIDHAVIFSNGTPVPFETKRVQFVEDIKLENDSQQLVLIWSGKSYYYTINTEQLRAIPAKSLKILEDSLKCTVIPVYIDKWLNLDEFEKIPWLLRELKERLNLDLNIAAQSII
ncbi:uncharacterized protein [Euwallacea fornicatus]|uniref:uncharacterized protein n=1 Tax=Euwallacea fornicatus TaxID=995702 RepID=UPI0033904631